MANWNLYDKFREGQNDGNAINLDTVLIHAAIVTSAYTPNQNTHDFWDDVVANEVSGTNYTAFGNACANPAITLAGSGNIKFDADDPATWLQHAAGFSNGRRIVLFYNTTVATTSKLIAYSDDLGADRGNVVGDYAVQLDAAGVWTSAR